MNAKSRLNRYLTGTFLLVFCTSSGILYRSFTEGAISDVKQESLLRMEMAIAVRGYTIAEIRPLLEANGQSSLPQAVPAHAALQTMSLLEKDHAGYQYREIAFNPINRANLPLPWQGALIQEFQRSPQLSSITRIFDEPGGPVMTIARPVRPTPDCLVCHGAPAAMPANLMQRYGPRVGAWNLTDVAGIQMVSVPMRSALAQARLAWTWHVLATVTVFGILFLVLNRLLSRTVIAPIETHSGIWRKLATTDALTGALNRRAFDAQAASWQAVAASSGGSLALVLVDIDHFKQVNDKFGHAAGDAVLKEFTRRILQSSKRRDSLYRIGGEEFALVLPWTSLSAAGVFAETLRRSFESASFDGVGRVTASFGVAELLPGEQLAELMARADQALYAAKRGGRDRVEIAAGRAVPPQDETSP